MSTGAAFKRHRQSGGDLVEGKQNIARAVCKQPAAKRAQSFPFLGQAVCHDLVKGRTVQADGVAGIRSSEERRNVRSAPV